MGLDPRTGQPVTSRYTECCANSWIFMAQSTQKLPDETLRECRIPSWLFWNVACSMYRHFGTTYRSHPSPLSNPFLYTRVNKNPSAWNFLSPKPEVTCGTVAIIIRVVLLSPYLHIRAVSLSSIHYNQSHRVYINRRRQYICLIWN